MLAFPAPSRPLRGRACVRSSPTVASAPRSCWRSAASASSPQWSAASAIQATASLDAQADKVVTLQQTLVADRAEVHNGQLKARMLVAQRRGRRDPRGDAGVPGQVQGQRASSWPGSSARWTPRRGARVIADLDRVKAGVRRVAAGPRHAAAPGGPEERRRRLHARLLGTVSQPLIDDYVDQLDAAAAALSAAASRPRSHRRHEQRRAPQRPRGAGARPARRAWHRLVHGGADRRLAAPAQVTCSRRRRG